MRKLVKLVLLLAVLIFTHAARSSSEPEAIRRTWTLQMEMRNASLDYEIHWRTR